MNHSDWEPQRLGDFVRFKHGFAFSSEHFSYEKGDMLLTPGNFYEVGGFRVLGDKQRRFHGEVPAGYSLKGGELVVVMTEQKAGLLGSAAFVPEGETYLHNQRLALVEAIDEQKVDLRFVYWQLCSLDARRQISKSASGTKVQHTSPKKLSSTRVPIPEADDQRAVVNVLDTWEHTIQVIDRLIERSCQQKKALAQQLLSGKRRLPGFQEKWESLKAEEVFRPVSIRGNPDEPLLAVTQDQGVIPRHLLERRVVMPEGSTASYKLVVPGNFVISLRSFQGGIEYADCRGLVSPAYTVLEPIVEIHDAYYRHYFKSTEFIGRLAVAVIGIRDGKQISYRDFSFIKTPVPPIDEQKAISEVLDQAESLIKGYQEQKAKLELEKRALMQQLLTGKRRVKLIPERTTLAKEHAS